MILSCYSLIPFYLGVTFCANNEPMLKEETNIKRNRYALRKAFPGESQAFFESLLSLSGT